MSFNMPCATIFMQNPRHGNAQVPVLLFFPSPFLCNLFRSLNHLIFLENQLKVYWLKDVHAEALDTAVSSQNDMEEKATDTRQSSTSWSSSWSSSWSIPWSPPCREIDIDKSWKEEWCCRRRSAKKRSCGSASAKSVGEWDMPQKRRITKGRWKGLLAIPETSPSFEG